MKIILTGATGYVGHEIALALANHGNQVINPFIKNKVTFIPKPGSFITNYCFICDIVKDHILAMEHGLSGEQYILGGINISYDDFFKEVRILSGSTANLIHVPKAVLTFLAVLVWCKYFLTKKEPFVTPKGIKQIFKKKLIMGRQSGIYIISLPRYRKH